MSEHNHKRRKVTHELADHDALEEDASPRPRVVNGEFTDAHTGRSPSSNQAGVLRGDYATSDPMQAVVKDGFSHKSNLFKLQVNEMLAEIRSNYSKRFKRVTEALHELKRSIEGIPDREPLLVGHQKNRREEKLTVKTPDAIKLMQKSSIAIPFPDPKPDPAAPYKLSYSRPENINVVGSYALETMVKSHASAVDLVVTMPRSILQEKDYLNYRYFYKRAYYLACIAAGLDRSIWRLQYDLLNGNDLQPHLTISAVEGTSVDFSASKCTIRLLVCAPDDFFAESKLRPDRNAIRPASNNDKTMQPAPTPFYNATMRLESNFSRYLKFLHTTCKRAEGFRDACILGRIWLQQRGHSSTLAKGGFGPFEWAALTALLLQGGGPKGQGVLSEGYSGLELFKATLRYIAGSNLVHKPVVIGGKNIELRRSELPMLFDGSRGMNILFKMSSYSYKALRAEALLTMEMINGTSANCFQTIFINRKDEPLLSFDSVITIDQHEKRMLSVSQDHLHSQRKLGDRSYHLLHEGLSDRVESIFVWHDEPAKWPLSVELSPSSSSLSIGLVFNPTHINRLVDHGPSSEDKDAATRFQQFWGDKAELRRFKNGSILESLIWSETEGSPFQQIVTYIMDRHLGCRVTFISNKLFEGFPEPDGSESFTALQQAFHNLESDLRSLEGLPLQVKAILAVDPQLRLSSPRPPLFSARHALKAPAEVIVQFEGSGRWPDDLIAIQRTKIAFLTKVADLLEGSVEGLKTRLGMEGNDKLLSNRSFLDIVYPSGAAFRLRVHNDREKILLERVIKDKGADASTREVAAESLSAYSKQSVQLPLITQSIITHCTRYPSLSSTLRLVKEWFRVHMLADHVPEEVMELLVMQTFLQPYPWTAPSTARTGLLRTLYFLAKWDWRSDPLIVDFGGTMTLDEVSKVHTRLKAWRKLDPAMNRVAMVVATSHDSTGTAFSNGRPSKVIAARMTSLARSACSIIGAQHAASRPQSLFASSTSDFDFVVQLAGREHAKRGKGKTGDATFQNLVTRGSEDLSDVDCRLTEVFYHEVRALYKGSVMFFYDGNPNGVLGGLWLPHTGPRSFRVNLSYASKPSGIEVVNEEVRSVEGEDHVVIDKAVILSEIARLGGDLVVQIETK